MFAVVKIGSSQYKVSPGQEILVDFQGKDSSKIELNQVLLLSDEGKTIVGKPFIEKAIVSAEVLGHPKGEKIRVGKFKAKSRYRKFRGFRASLTKIKITHISAEGSAPIAAPVAAEKKTAPRTRKTAKTS
jgi:large subunit ribosomal protein L21